MAHYLGRKIPPNLITLITILIVISQYLSRYGLSMSDDWSFTISAILVPLVILNIASFFVDGVIYLSDTRTVVGHIMSFVIVGVVLWFSGYVPIIYIIVFGLVDIFVKSAKEV